MDSVDGAEDEVAEEEAAAEADRAVRLFFLSVSPRKKSTAPITMAATADSTFIHRLGHNRVAKGSIENNDSSVPRCM